MECKKIFSYTKKILKLSFLSFILSISFSNKGVFARPDSYNAALPVESSGSASDSVVEYAYKSTSTTPDTDDENASAPYYTPNSDGTTATATVPKSGSQVFSKIRIDVDQSGSTTTKELKVSKITMFGDPPLDFSIFVLDANNKITIEPTTGEKNSILTVYLPSGVKPTDVFENVAESDVTEISRGITKYGATYDKYSISVKSVAKTPETTESESLSSDEESNSNDSNSNNSNSSNNSNNSSSSSSTSNSSSNYSSSNYNSGSSYGSSSSASSTKSTTGTTKSSSSSSGSSSASKSASTKTFGSSFNPFFLLSGVCIPLFKKKKN